MDGDDRIGDHITTHRPTFEHEVTDLLELIKFLLNEGAIQLDSTLLSQLWNALIYLDSTTEPRTVFPAGMDACCQLLLSTKFAAMQNTEEFFRDYVLQLDPAQLSVTAMQLFLVYFRRINSDRHLLLCFSSSQSTDMLVNGTDLCGVEFVWRVMLNANCDQVAQFATDLLVLLHTQLGPSMRGQERTMVDAMMRECFDRLKKDYYSVSMRWGVSGDTPLPDNVLLP